MYKVGEGVWFPPVGDDTTGLLILPEAVETADTGVSLDSGCIDNLVLEPESVFVDVSKLGSELLDIFKVKKTRKKYVMMANDIGCVEV